MLTVLLFRQSFSQQNEFLTIVKLHKKKKKTASFLLTIAQTDAILKKTEKERQNEKIA